MLFHTFTSIFFLAAIMTSGCSGENWRASTIPVHGSLLVNGEAHKDIYVILVSREKDVDIRGTRPWGRTDEAGQFSLSTYKKGDGCPYGNYALTVKWPVDPARLTSQDRLNDRFSSPKDSEMMLTIDEKTTLLPVIELNDVKVMTTGLGTTEPDRTSGFVRRPKSP